MKYFSRLSTLQQRLQPQQAILLSCASDVTYFSGFQFLVPEEREGLLWVTQDTVVLFHANFSPLPALPDTIQTFNSVAPRSVSQYLQQFLATQPLSEILIDEESLFVHEYHQLKALDSQTLTPLPRSWIWDLRMIKDEQEIANSKEASRIVSTLLKDFQATLKPGITELEVANLLEAKLINEFHSKPAFPIIVAFGKHSALPHHQPTDTPLESESAVLIDIGAFYQGYRSDITRSFWFGAQPPEQYVKIKDAVELAYANAYSLLRESAARFEENQERVTAQQLDDAARSMIERCGFADYFIHTTGHGVGLDIHEPPSISWNNPQQILPGMIITIEPGIYLPNQFGYRYENTIAVQADVQEITLV